MKAKRGLWLVGSAVIHIVVVLLLLQAMLTPRFFIALFAGKNEPIKVENLTYVVPMSPAPPPRAAAPRTPPRVQIQIVPVAPRDIPTVLPAIPAIPTVTVPVDSGPDRAVAGPPSGNPGLPAINPSNPDPRIYIAGPPITDGPKRTGLDAIKHSLDSAVRAKREAEAMLRNPNDWTVGEGKKKFGMDQSWLYLGPIKIPTLLLAFVPLKGVQGNPGSYEKNRTLGAMAAEVRERDATAQSQHDEIQAIHARMDRERKARLRAAAAASSGGKIPPP